MKKKNKVLRLMMALIMTVMCVLPTGGMVYANYSFTYRPSKIEVTPSNKQLIDGQYFDIVLTAYLREGVEANLEGEVTSSVRDVYLKGAVESGTRPFRITSIIRENKCIGVEIYVDNLQYQAPMDDLTISINNGEEKTFKLDVENVSAGEAIGFVNPGTINLVVDERQQLPLTVKNNSKLTSKEGKLSLAVEGSQSKKYITLDKKEFSIPKMKPGEKKTFYVSVDILEGITRGVHELTVTVDGVKHTLNLKVDSDFMPPSLELSVNNTSGFVAGKPQKVALNIKNVGHVDAKNVKAEIVANEKIVVTDGSNVRYLNTVGSGKTGKIDVSLQVVDTSSAVIPLQIKLSFIDDLGKTQEDSQTVYINTQKVAFAKELTIKDIKEPTGKYGVGQSFNVGFSVFAEDGADNVTVSVKGPEGIVPASKNMFVVQKLQKGGKQNFNVSFMANNTVATGTHLIEIEAKYKLNNEEVSMKQYTTVSINNPKKEEDGEEDKKGGKPKVIIGMYQSDPIVVKAGEQFNLSLGFLNTHNDKSVHNLKANLTIKEEGENGTGSVFTPVGASNTFYIPQMAPGEVVQKEITMYTLPSAKPKTYEITIDMEYEDSEGTEITDTENIGIPVEQITKLEVADVQLDTVEVGMESYLTARIYNTGKTAISNVKIQTVGEGFEVRDNTMFIGNLDKGATENYEPTIIPNIEGILKGQILVEYEDVAGVVQTLVHDFDFEVMAPQIYPGEEVPFPGEEVPLPEENKSKLPLIIGGVVGVIIAAGITVVVLKKRRKKKEALELDAD